MASPIENWLATASRNTVAVVAIGVGILLIILFNPPTTVCDTQFEMFQKLQKGFLFVGDADRKTKKLPSFGQLYEYCKQGTSPGACYELFAQLRTLLRDLDTVPAACSSAVGGSDQVREALWKSVELIVRLAWGDKPPGSVAEKFGWLDTADLALFCGLRQHITTYYGDGAWDGFQERMFKDLPGAKDVPRKAAWDTMILSEICNRYL